MMFQSLPHLDLITRVGCQKIGTDEQEDQMSRVNGLIDSLSTIRSCKDLLVMPLTNQLITFKLHEVIGKLITQILVGGCVGVEDGNSSMFLRLLHALVPPIPCESFSLS